MSYTLMTPGLLSMFRNGTQEFSRVFGIRPLVTSKDSQGRIVSAWASSNSAIFTGILSQATQEETDKYKQPGHEVSHVISQFGAPISGIKPGDRLILDGLFYYIMGIDNIGAENNLTRYFVEMVPGL